MKRKKIVLVWLLGAILIIASIASAERLPVRVYTTADGLANDGVNRIVRDSRGFLWFCTNEGLSRFDGFGFKNYTQNEGLPNRNINDFLETRNGDLLVATSSGLAIFDPNGKAYRWNILDAKLEQNSSEPPMFRTFAPSEISDQKAARTVLSLTEDRAGNVFAGTRRGLFQVKKNDGEWSFKKIESGEWTELTEFSALKFDAAGYLWAVTSTGIYRLSPGGAIENFHQDGGGSILADDKNQIWIGGSGTNAGLRVFTVSADGTEAQLTKTYHKSDGLPGERSMFDIVQTSTGKIYVQVAAHLCEFLPDEEKFRIVEDGGFQSLAEDAGGNLWLGTMQEGAWKLALSGFTRYDERDGLPAADISSLGVDRTGNVFITDGQHNISRLTDGKFETVTPLGLTIRSWGNRQLDFQEASGDWWIPSANGLLHYPSVKDFGDLARTPPTNIYTTADGLFGNDVFNIFEDSHGNVWLGTTYTKNSVHFWEKKTGTIHRFTSADNLPESNGAVSFAEDAGGNVWIGFYDGGVARYRNGEFDFFAAGDGIPESFVSAILSDKTGRLWIATASRGVIRVDNPTADAPTFLSLSTAGGLSSNQTNCLTEDDFGHVYIGTGRGVDRLDPLRGRIKSFTQSDGLPGSVVQYCRRDAKGALWFVSRNILAKLVPQTETVLNPPPVFIGGINVNGIARPISQLGVQAIENLDLSSDERQLRLDFFALGFNAGDRIRYQYKLNNEDWHEPEDVKSVNFNLAPGDYRFAVRAVNADNEASENPATVSFKIATPFWRRWWFLMLVALIIAAAIFALDRFRVKKTKQVETALEISRESAARFRTLAQTASDAIITVNKDSRIVFVNDAVETIFGYTEAELIGADLTMLMPDALRSAHHAGMERYVATNKKHISWAAIELPGKHKTGAEIPLELSFGEFTSDGERYFTGIARDVSERRKAEEKLRHAFGDLSVSENRFRQMNEQSPLGTVIFAPDGSIRSVNKAYEDFWGITFEQIKHWDFLSDEQIIKSGVADKLRPVFAGGTMALPPIPYDPQTNGAGVKVDEKAETRWIQSFAYPVKSDAGELLEVVLVMEDVTDSKRAAEIEQKAKTDRLRELEQVRRRIAADLHDDIGSSLTQISIFSEVLQQRVDKTNERVLEPLEFIAGSSRELVDAMSDIVWAINPQKDFLSELTGKMRRFASDVFTARDIKFAFDAPDLNEEFSLGANLRREVFLIFKESVNNIVKHSKCSRAEIKLSVENAEIRLSLHDNGAGFDTNKINDGHGLVSMKQRAKGLGGTLRIVSGNLTGTTTTLIAPLGANADEKVLQEIL